MDPRGWNRDDEEANSGSWPAARPREDMGFPGKLYIQQS